MIQALTASSSPARARARARARSSRSATPSSRSSASSAPTRRAFAAMRDHFAERPGPRASAGTRSTSTSPSARPRRCSALSTRSSPVRGARRRAVRRAGRCATTRSRSARPGWSSSGRRRRRTRARPSALGAAAGTPAARPAAARLARLIARRIQRWTRDPEGAEDPESLAAVQGPAPAARRLLVLVRRRNEFVEELVRELKQLRRAGRRRRPHGPDRAAGGHGPDRAGPLPAAAGRRPDPGDGPQGPLVGSTRSSSSPWPTAAGHALAAAAGGPGERPCHGRMAWDLCRAAGPGRLPAALRALSPSCSADGAAGRACWPASARKPPTRSRSSSSLALAYEREHRASLEGFLHWLEAGGRRSSATWSTAAARSG